MSNADSVAAVRQHLNGLGSTDAVGEIKQNLNGPSAALSSILLVPVPKRVLAVGELLPVKGGFTNTPTLLVLGPLHEPSVKQTTALSAKEAMSSWACAQAAAVCAALRNSFAKSMIGHGYDLLLEVPHSLKL